MEVFRNLLIRNWFGLLIAVIILFCWFGTCERNDILEANNKALSGKNTTYKNAYGTLTTKVNTLQADKSELNQLLSDTVSKLAKKFSRVEMINTVTTITNFDTIKIPFKEPIPCSFVREDIERKEWYSFKYKIDSTSLTISSLQIPNEQIVISGMQRKWFLGKQTLVTEITNTNPNIVILNATSIKTTIKPKWWESKTAIFVAGFLTAKAQQKIIK